jgi:dTDP-4-amino-4,6-dideoxygalactose transaminase
MAIARSCTYHTLGFDVRNLVGSVVRAEGRSARGDAEIAAFEEAFAAHVGSASCTSFAFARTAVHAALEAAGLSEGAEVILPPLTIKAMVDVVLALGLVPMYVDIDPDTLIFDLDRLDEALGPRTGAVLVTYLFGIAGDPAPIVARCRAAGVLVIEDFSHALGATVRNQALGTFGDVGVYSCSVTKALDTYGGGMAVTDDERLSERLRSLQRDLAHPPRRRLPPKVLVGLVTNLASRKAAWSTVAFPLTRTIRRRRSLIDRGLARLQARLRTPADLSSAVFERITPRQARAGLALLPEVSATDRARREAAESLRARLRSAGVRVPLGSPDARHVHWQAVAYAGDAEVVQARLAKRGIDAATTNLPLVVGIGVEGPQPPCPVGADVKHRALFLPAYPRLSQRDRERVATAAVEAFAPPVPGSGAAGLR